MSQNHVDQPHAQLLKEAGWDKKTELIWAIVNWTGDKESSVPQWSQPEWALEPYGTTKGEWYPAPNLSELLDQITFTDLETYWFKVAIYTSGTDCFDEWLYETMKDPNALARIWVWKEGG